MTTTLLAIDDSKTMRRVLEITFAGEAYRTVLSDSAPDAIAKLRAESPAVALVDAGLDGTDGYALCKQLKQASPRVRVIVLSSKQQPYDRVRGSAAGADDYIDKPFDTQQLLDKVGSLAKAHAAAAPEPVAVARPTEASVAAARPDAWQAASRSAAPELEVIEDDEDELLESEFGHQVAPLDESDLPASIVPPRRTAQPAAAAAPSAAVAKAPAAATTGAVALGAANLEHKLAGLGLTSDQLKGVLALSREVIEQVVWEVVPVLAETLIKEEISRLTRE